MASNPIEMAPNLITMASNLTTMASNLLAMASNLTSKASTYCTVPYCTNLLFAQTEVKRGGQPQGRRVVPFQASRLQGRQDPCLGMGEQGLGDHATSGRVAFWG